MHDHRLVKLATNADVMTEGLLLLRFSFRGVKIVQPGFAQGNDALFCRHAAQIFHGVGFILIQRMNPAGKDDVIANANQLAHASVARKRSRNGKTEFHIAGGGFCQHVIDVFMQGLIIQAIEMAV
ncbi:hypothetical protein HMPREF0880_03031 [Yokenella regensburgei ATCC 43003]|nr:hypothetical protein HMPREF0880_03031 [Yokenella regensburgei ATCC 43003]